MPSPAVFALVEAATPVLNQALADLTEEQSRDVLAWMDEGHHVALQIVMVDRALSINFVVTDPEGQVTAELQRLGY